MQDITFRKVAKLVAKIEISEKELKIKWLSYELRNIQGMHPSDPTCKKYTQPFKVF